MKNYKLYSILFLFSAFILNSCTEAYPLLTNTYEEALVVEATITNELKNQEIKLTKSAKFEDEKYLTESGAEVYITDNSGNRYDFEDQSDKYVSTVAFQAAPGTQYQLHINTKDGRTFESSPETLSTVTPMQSVKAAIEKDKDDKRGVSIRVNSFDPTNKSHYYRYEYEETYKVVAPKWVPTKAFINQNGGLTFGQNDPNTKTCYGNKKSTDLLLLNTTDLKEDRVDYLARFISDQDYIITTRYSILVKQYVESLAAFNYYSTLKKISGSASLLSPTQPGIVLGNLKSTKNPNDKIVGYFDVASISIERIYFNYNDLFLGEPPPPFYTDCQEFCYANYPFSPDPCTHSGGYFDDLEMNNITYYLNGAFYYWVYSPCGDCTTIASNVKPTFWVD
ncbi:DUF4249 domain-containing protein [Flavobacterium sp. UBA7680]|uniref:DUF4249 domain-containing protein n=1 Tax=Flavobacterium sp. UBA7680 TaxID=1946559 RepID=UPI0025C5F3D2|nr:DUF4249 domain-containing protein [Flavobacterium sp. UBA7680]